MTLIIKISFIIVSPTLIRLTAEGTNNTGIININQSATSSICLILITPVNKHINIIPKPYTLAGIGNGKINPSSSPIKETVKIIKN